MDQEEDTLSIDGTRDPEAWAVQVHADPALIDAQAWDALVEASPAPTPFMHHAYLCALHTSASAVAER